MLGIYCRISQLKDDGKDRSIEDQKQLGIELAQKLDINYKIYIDEGFSGALENISDRPDFERMLEDIESRIIDCVYVFDQSRLERNPQIRFAIKRIFKTFNISLYTYNGKVNLDDDEEEMFGDIMSIYNQYFVKLTSKKIKSVLLRNAREGKAHSSILPYGYKKDEKGLLVIDNEEEKIIKRIFQESLEGIGTNKIAENLNNDEILTRYQKIGTGSIKIKNRYTGELTEKKKKDIAWAGNTIRSIIKNPIYKGERNFAGEIVNSPIIIDPIIWKMTNENLSKNRNNSGKKVEHAYLLKGMLECAYCGRNMYGKTRVNKKDNYYMCSSKRIKSENCGNKSVNIQVMDSAVWNTLFTKYETRIAIIQDDKNNTEKRKNQIDVEITELKKEEKHFTNQLERAINLVVEEIIDEIEGKSKISSVKAKITEIKRKIENLNEEKIYENRVAELENSISDDFQTMKEEAPFNKKQEIIKKYINRIKVFFDKETQFYFLTYYFNLPKEKEIYMLNGSIQATKNYLAGKPTILEFDFLENVAIKSLEYSNKELASSI